MKISLLRIGRKPTEEQLKKMTGTKTNGMWFRAKKSPYNTKEIEIDVWYEEKVETGVKRSFTDDTYEVIEYLKEKGKEVIIRKVYCFLDSETLTLEIYRGPDGVTYKIKEELARLLKTKIEPITLSSQQLQKLINKHSLELKQVMFKYVDGLWYQILRGRHIETNQKYKNYLKRNPESLRTISIIPKIKYLNGSEYQVTINGDKGTLSYSAGLFKWKPRIEIKQVVNLVTKQRQAETKPASVFEIKGGVKLMESMKEFIDQFGSFKALVKESQITIDEENLITLFAIFKKDCRTEKIQNNNNDTPATEKQISFLKSLAEGKDTDIDWVNLTKKQASDWITKLRGE